MMHEKSEQIAMIRNIKVNDMKCMGHDEIEKIE